MFIDANLLVFILQNMDDIFLGTIFTFAVCFWVWVSTLETAERIEWS